MGGQLKNFFELLNSGSSFIKFEHNYCAPKTQKTVALFIGSSCSLNFPLEKFSQ